ncbi:T-cell surface glycoprotein CD3 zeta chain-like isoform X2 [Engraulis encrasicolus]|uniref:T-cell surface glycoprotein CD3 zeta chain-like isoform X2 n=1 Tax=Engraulis encrasicolus TaxID=184585 RepID=UPI002FD1737B
MARMWGATCSLLVLSMMVHGVDAVSDPVICYILDAFLLLYCIIFTALFFRQKFEQNPLVTEEENKETEGEGEGGTYEAVGTQINPEPEPEPGPVRRQRGQAQQRAQPEATDDNYAALQHRTGDTYAKIQGKGKKKKKKEEQGEASGAYEALTRPSADTYNALEMRPLPPRNPPN